MTVASAGLSHIGNRGDGRLSCLSWKGSPPPVFCRAPREKARRNERGRDHHRRIEGDLSSLSPLLAGLGLIQGCSGYGIRAFYSTDIVLFAVIFAVSTIRDFKLQAAPHYVPAWILSAWRIRSPVSALVTMRPIAHCLSRLRLCARPMRVMYVCLAAIQPCCRFWSDA